MPPKNFYEKKFCNMFADMDWGLSQLLVDKYPYKH